MSIPTPACTPAPRPDPVPRAASTAGAGRPMDRTGGMENAHDTLAAHCTRVEARFPSRLGRTERRPYAPQARSLYSSNTTSRRKPTEERRCAPTSVHVRRIPCSRSPDSAFNFTGIRSTRTKHDDDPGDVLGTEPRRRDANREHRRRPMDLHSTDAEQPRLEQPIRGALQRDRTRRSHPEHPHPPRVGQRRNQVETAALPRRTSAPRVQALPGHRVWGRRFGPQPCRTGRHAVPTSGAGPVQAPQTQSTCALEPGDRGNLNPRLQPKRPGCMQRNRLLENHRAENQREIRTAQKSTLV